jgi:ParB-like chromosome segregation protein Spo0J
MVSGTQMQDTVPVMPVHGEHAIELIPVAALRPADSPRLSGIDEAHVAVLVECDAQLPPILVHRRSMRVIDGMHRMLAARRLEKTHIAVQYFDGDEDAAFVRSVTDNISHGLTLSIDDRKAAAVRIMECYPAWSDRRVGRASGLSGKTVAALRKRMMDDVRTRRIGEDGRVRPINGASGRQLAGQILAAHPEASLRQVALAAGIAPATVRDVRDRLRRGDSPMTATQLQARRDDEGEPVVPRPEPRPPRRAYRQDDDIDPQSTLKGLREDPSLRYTDAGRTLLRWLDRYLVGADFSTGVVSAAPPHCLPLLARLARHCAAEWEELAEWFDRDRVPFDPV